VVDTLYKGPWVPDWFKEGSDGCSVPTRLLKWLLQAEDRKVLCYIHDFEYYLASLQYTKKSRERKYARRTADRNFRDNIRKAAKHAFLGWAYGGIYFAGVRMGGGLVLSRDTVLRPPPEQFAWRALAAYLDEPITDRAALFLRVWVNRMKREGTWRKES